MTDPQRAVVAAWISEMKGNRTGDDFAEDVTRTTGWNVDRTRLSRYGKGSIPIGRDVIAHLSAYAEAKGFPPLDLTPPAPVLSLEERAVIAAERQAAAMETTKEPGGITGLFMAFTRALEVQAQMLTDIRLELAEAARNGERERQESARLLGDLAAQLADLRSRVGMQAGSAVPGSGRQ